MADVLLTVSGTLDPARREQIAQGACPRADYYELARALGADLLDYDGARRQGGLAGRVLGWLGGADLMLAWACWRQRRSYRTIFTDGEQVGLPLAALLKWFGRGGARHLMIVHILSAGKKRLFLALTGVQTHIDQFFCYSTWQKRFIEERLGVPGSRVIWTPFMVDADFFSCAQVTPRACCGRRQICAVGLEFRDYPTLMRAVDGLDVQVVIAAASPWSKRADTTQDRAIPSNVTVQRFSQFELRQLYADSAFVVMPLFNVNFQAGITAILEAMAMSRAVICSRTPGQTDAVVDGENGLYVPANDAAALRAAISNLLEHPAEAARLGQGGRRLVESQMSLDRYVARLQAYACNTNAIETQGGLRPQPKSGAESVSNG